jgi:hypothetical protein
VVIFAFLVFFAGVFGFVAGFPPVSHNPHCAFGSFIDKSLRHRVQHDALNA